MIAAGARRPRGSGTASGQGEGRQERGLFQQRTRHRRKSRELTHCRPLGAGPPRPGLRGWPGGDASTGRAPARRSPVQPRGYTPGPGGQRVPAWGARASREANARPQPAVPCSERGAGLRGLPESRLGKEQLGARVALRAAGMETHGPGPAQGPGSQPLPLHLKSHHTAAETTSQENARTSGSVM